MKKTTKKLSIRKETIASFEDLSKDQMQGIQGGLKADQTGSCSKFDKSC